MIIYYIYVSDGEYKLSRSQQLRGKIREEEMKECTFTPELITRTSWDKAKAAADRKRVVEEFYRQHSGVDGNPSSRIVKRNVGHKGGPVSSSSSIASSTTKSKRNIEPPRRFSSGQSNDERYNGNNINPNTNINRDITERKSFGNGSISRNDEIIVPKVADNSEALRSVVAVRELLNNKAANLTSASRDRSLVASQRTPGSASYGGMDLAETIGVTIIPVKAFAPQRSYFE